MIVSFGHSLLRMLCIFIPFIQGITVFAQIKPISFSGSVNISSEFYGTTDTLNRRPGSALLTIFQINTNIYDNIQLPINLHYFLSRRSFDQFGISPRFFGWAVLHAGYFSTSISEFTFGDVRLLGGGIELSPGQFRFSVLRGRAKQAIESDTTQGARGQYKRMISCGKIGYGQENKIHFDLSFLHAKDDVSSISNDSPSLKPQENLVSSIAFGFPLLDNTVKAQGEVALSVFTNDLRADELADAGGFVRRIFTPRISTQIDGAAKLSLGLTPIKALSLMINSKWIGPGFVTLGYQYLANDIFEISFTPSLRLFDNKFFVRSSLGYKLNNLRNNRFATTKRTIGSIGLSGQPTKELGFDLQYSNYAMNSNPKNDTLRMDNVAQSLSISPRIMFESLGGTNSVALSYMLQDVNDNNVVSSNINRNTTHSVSSYWSLLFPSSLNFSTSVMYTSSSMASQSIKTTYIGEVIGWQFFERKLSTSLSTRLGFIKAQSKDTQINSSLDISYSFEKWGTLSGGLSVNRYVYGSESTGKSFTEVLGSLRYGITI